MAISYVSGSNTTYASRTNTTITAPSGIANNDILLASMFTGQGSSGTPDPTAPAGWTEIGTAQSNRQGAGPFYVEFRIYIKTAASESGDYTFTHSSCSSQGVMACFRGVDTTTPQDVTATTNRGNGVSRTWTGLTTTTANVWIVGFGHDFADTSNNLTAPTGMTERMEVNALTYLVTELIATASATGDRTHNCNSSNADSERLWETRLIALRSDGAAAPTPASRNFKQFVRRLY